MGCNCGRKSVGNWSPRGLRTGPPVTTPSQKRAVQMQSAQNNLFQKFSENTINAKRKEIETRRRMLALRKAGMA